MNWHERRKALEQLSERDKLILKLARRVSNNLGFAMQNMGRAAEERYCRQADEAMQELEDIVLGLKAPQPQPEAQP